MPGVELEQRDLHRHDPAEQRAERPDPQRGCAAGGRRRGARAARGRRGEAGAASVRGAPRAAARRAPAGRGDRAARDRARTRGAGRAARAVEAARACGGRGRARERASCAHLLVGELAGGAQAGRLRARVVGDLARRRRDRAAEHELGLRRPAAAADGQVGRADAAARAVGEEALDAAVLERVERDRGEPAADAQQVPRARERLVELAQLVVDRDPDRLERALGRDGRRRTARARGSRP